MNRFPKLAGTLALAAALAQPSPAQGDQDDLIRKRDDKLASAWLENADWITDYDAARAKAKESGKLIFGYFTRSYSP